MVGQLLFLEQIITSFLCDLISQQTHNYTEVEGVLPRWPGPCLQTWFTF